jgi:hypothetical protein
VDGQVVDPAIAYAQATADHAAAREAEITAARAAAVTNEAVSVAGFEMVSKGVNADTKTEWSLWQATFSGMVKAEDGSFTKVAATKNDAFATVLQEARQNGGLVDVKAKRHPERPNLYLVTNVTPIARPVASPA